MQELRFTVPGMSCAHCEQAVSAEVGKVAGVAGVDVDLETKVVAVRGDDLSEASVRSAIVEAGYDPA